MIVSGARTKIKRPHFTNDELFYDPELDEQDQNWINMQRKTCMPIKTDKASGSILKKSETNDNKMETETQKIYSDNKTDAILNCPCCMSLLTMDCQR
jgi:hypothetical protein